MEIRIRSITDVITNSSSECFIATKKVNDRLFKDLGLQLSKSTRITESMLKGDWGKTHWMEVLEALGLPYTYASVSGEEPSKERWEEVLMKEIAVEAFNYLLNLYWIEVDEIEWDNRVDGLIEMFVRNGAIKCKIERNG